jgi:hypothetical protein
MPSGWPDFYRFLEPSSLHEVYGTAGGRSIKVIRRRGFGQLPLSNLFPAGSIGVFMHRGDSRAEGGSNVYYLANRPKQFEPCGSLFEKLTRSLTDRALILSDGSNSDIPEIKKFFNSDTSGREAFAVLRNAEFAFGAFKWRCVGWLRHRYGPTLAWGLERVAQAMVGPDVTPEDRNKSTDKVADHTFRPPSAP